MKKNTEKILLDDHEEEAQAFIAELENTYLPAVNGVYQRMLDLGVKVPSKAFLFDVINGNFEAVELAYNEVTGPDLNQFSSPVLRDKMKLEINQRLGDFCNSIPAVFAKRIIVKGDSLLLNDKYFQEFISFGDSGPFISDSSREEIAESFREYLTDKKLVKVYEAQHQAAKSLQEFWDAMFEAKMTTAINPTFMMALFDIQVLSREEGIYTITAKKLNFK